MPRKPKPPAREIAKTQAELANKMGVNRRTVNEWIARGMPVNDDDTYDVGHVRSWREVALAKKSPPKDPDIVELTIKEKQYKVANLKHQARSRKLKADEGAKKVYPADQVDDWIITAFTRLKRRIEQWPTEVRVAATATIRDQVRADLAEAVRQLLIEIAGFEFNPDES